MKVSNGVVEIGARLDAGPRITHYALLGRENVLGHAPDVAIATPMGTWHALGGHRLWAAPESSEISYAPDNEPVESRSHETGFEVWRAADAAGLAKSIAVELAHDGSGVTLFHRLTNARESPVTVAPWALTILRGGGTVVIPQEPFRAHSENFLPARPLVMWHYTDFTDSRWNIGSRMVRLHADPARPAPQKIGCLNRQGWCAYIVDQTVFIKRFDCTDGAAYPDFGCNNEVYVAGAFVEIESLGPLVTLGTGATAELRERWHLFDGVDMGSTEDSVLSALLPLVALTAH